MPVSIDTIARKLVSGHINFFLGSAASVPFPVDNWLETGTPPSAKQLRTWLLASSLKLHGEANDLRNNESAIFGERGGSLAEVASYFELSDSQVYRESLRRAFTNSALSRSRRDITVPCIPDLIAESIDRANKHSRQAGSPCQYPIVMTTNFDTFIENALEDRRIPYRVFVLSEGAPHRLIERTKHFVSDELTAKDLKSSKAIEYSVHILKLHGQIGANDADPTKIVMSESDYVRYLIDTPIDRLMPFDALKTAIDNRACLFLGYSFGDWNMRAFLRYLWPSGSKPGTSRWAIALGFSRYQELFLEKEFGVETISQDLNRFCEEVRRAWEG